MGRARATRILLWTVVAAAIAATTAALFFDRAGAGAAVEGAATAASGDARAALAGAASRAASDATTATRAPASSADLSGTELRASNEPDPSRLALVVARFVSPSGEPIAGYVVASVTPPGPTIESGADGRITWRESVPPGETERSADLVAKRKGSTSLRLVARLAPGETTHLGDVVGLPGSDVSGRVVDSKGDAVAGAQLSATPTYGPKRDSTWTAWSGADGAFSFDGVPVGIVRITAVRVGYDRDRAVVDVVEGESSSDVLLTLQPIAPEELIRGRVVSPEGKPVPSARLRSSHETKSGGRGWIEFNADDAGAFVVSLRDNSYSEPTLPWRDLDAWDPTRDLEPASAKRVAAGTDDLVLRLNPGKRWWLEVRDDAGAPVVEFRAWTADALDGARPPQGTVLEEWISPDFEFQDGYGRTSGLHEAGRASLPLPHAPFVVRVDAPGFRLAEIGPLDPSAMPPATTVRLARARFLRGRVTAKGNPVAGARVVLCEAVREKLVGILGPFRVRSFQQGFEPLRETTTDASGAYRFQLSMRGAFYLRAEAPGLAADDVGPLDLDRETNRDGVDVSLTPGGAIEGRALLQGDVDPSGLIVGVSRGDGFPQTKRVGPDGAFRFTGLAPGTWHLARCATDQLWIRTSKDLELAAPVLASCTVAVGQTSRLDLDLR